MPKSKETHLSDLQLAVMRVLWERGEATANAIFEVVGKARGLAFTTIATILSRLEKRGVITHRTEKRQYIYRALTSEREVRRSMVRDLVQSLFQGDSAALVTHLLTKHLCTESAWVWEGLKVLLTLREGTFHFHCSMDAGGAPDTSG